MYPVSNDDGTLYGYMRPEFVMPPVGFNVPDLAPIVDDQGKLIGYMGQDIGWVTLAEHDTPGFTFEGAVKAYRERTAAQVGCPVDTLEDCIARQPMSTDGAAPRETR